MLFKVKGSVHVDKGKIYKTGEIVDSPVDLTKIFRDKFEKVADTLSSPATVAEKGVDTIQVILPPSPPASKVIGKNVKAPVIIKERLEKELEENPYGEDVTNQYLAAEQLALKVFVKFNKLNKGRYTIIDTEDNKILNDKLLKKSEVLPFLQNLQEE